MPQDQSTLNESIPTNLEDMESALHEAARRSAQRILQQALEHHWYPTAVRIKQGALPSQMNEKIGFHFEAGSVSTADRRGADRGVEIVADSS
jgi:hypothetical protein